MLCPPVTHLCWRLCLHLGFRIFDGRLAVYVKDNINPTTLSTLIQHPGQDGLYQLSKCFVVAVHPFTRPIPPMIHVDGVVTASAGDTFFSSSLASAAIFVFRRDPSAFASAHGSGPSGWVRTSFTFTLLLSATRIIWLKRFRSAFRRIFWPLIRDVFVLIVENVLSLCFVILSWNFTDGGSSYTMIRLNNVSVRCTMTDWLQVLSNIAPADIRRELATWKMILRERGRPELPLLTDINFHPDHEWNRDVPYGLTPRIRPWPSNTSGAQGGRTKPSTSQTSPWSRILPSSYRECTCPWPMEPAKQVPNGCGTMSQQHAWAGLHTMRLWWTPNNEACCEWVPVDLLQRWNLRTTSFTGCSLQLAAETKLEIMKSKRHQQHSFKCLIRLFSHFKCYDKILDHYRWGQSSSEHANEVWLIRR